MTFDEKMAEKYRAGGTVDSIIADFKEKFEAMLKWRQEQDDGVLTLRGYEKQIFALRALWQRVVTSGVALPEFAWRKMYATAIAPMREELFADEMMERRLVAADEEPIADPEPSEVQNRARTFDEYK
jgi:hypothetical protein